ncbi:MAG: TonB-dependent receptor plug domain-containing protein [Thermoanaerobaculia bacterium]
MRRLIPFTFVGRGIARGFLAAAAALAGLAPAQAAAQAFPAAAAVIQDQLVVTAALEATEERELPASIEVIDREEIEARQATTIAELLETVTGLHTVRSGSAGKTISLFSRGTESDHTLVLWNGVELNNPYFGGFDWAFMPTEGVERVEVVRGPFSALHGSDALGGAVQILSARDNGGAVRLEAGERGYRRGALSFGADLGGVRLDLAGHLREGDGLEINDFYDAGELVASLDWNLGSSATLGVVARINESEVGIPRSSGVLSPNRRIDWQERQIAVPYTKRLDKWSLDAQISSVTLESSFRDPDDAFGFTASDTRSDARRVRAQAGRRFRQGSWLAFGAEAERLEVDDESVFGVNLRGARQETTAVFAQGLRRFESFTLDAGARYDQSDVYGGRLTPRLGVLLPLGANTSLRASYGEGFRAPSLGELFFQFSGNAALEPEESESLEAGFEHRGDRWQLELVGFENRLINLIDFDFATFTNLNVGRALTRGIEARIAYERTGASIRGTATVQETEDRTTGLPLLRRPEERASLVVTGRGPAVIWSATAVYVGERADVDPVTFSRALNPDYFRLDLAAEFRGFDRWSPHARLENALDERYEEALGFPAAPRSLVGGISFRWQ